MKLSDKEEVANLNGKVKVQKIEDRKTEGRTEREER